MSGENVIVLCGPSTDPGSEGYGGGKGGYVRNVAALLSHFSKGDVKIMLSPYSTRRYTRWWKFALPFRLIADLFVFSGNVRRGSAVHVMMAYGPAIYREFGMSVIAAAVRRPMILDIRGGAFVPWLQSTGWLQRIIAHWALRHATIVLGQGEAVVASLKPRYGNKVHHFPNFIQSRYLPAHVGPRFAQPELQVVFVGYCYAGKGVFELVAGCASAARRSVAVQLTMVGAESAEFAAYLDRLEMPEGLRINRRGTLEYDAVQSVLARQDIFCFPTRHFGEGHPNVITEAMAHGLVIVSTRHGFISELLDETSAYFVESESADAIADKLVHIHDNRIEAQHKADKAHSTVKERFTEAQVLGQLREYYLSAVGHAQGLQAK